MILGPQDSGKVTEALTMLTESSAQAPHDFCGEQRYFHLPRITKAWAILAAMFPTEAMEAMIKAKDPEGDFLTEPERD